MSVLHISKILPLPDFEPLHLPHKTTNSQTANSNFIGKNG